MTKSLYQVNRIVKIKYQPDFSVELHSHSFFHYIYVLSGTGIANIENNIYTINPDELYLFSPGIRHYILGDGVHWFRTIEVKFEVNSEELYAETCRLPTAMKVNGTGLRTALEIILAEAEHKFLYYSELINSKFSTEMLRMLRANSADMIKKATKPEDLDFIALNGNVISSLQRVVVYIDEHLNQNISTVDLSRIAALSENHLCVLFKNCYGISINKYVSFKKRSKAKSLIMDTDMNLYQIADALGFSSLSYFSKFFKKHEGISPTEYKKKLKNDIRIDIE